MLYLLTKLEEFYKFECEGGELKNCTDWIQLKELIHELNILLGDTQLPSETAQEILEIFYKKFTNV